MKHEIWEFLAGGRYGVIRKWLEEESVSVQERAKMDVSLNRLQTLDFGLVGPKLLAGPVKGTKIYKLRLRCENRELRPMLCRGPVGSPGDYTLLLGAIEVGGRLHPHDAVVKADGNRESLLKNPTWRKVY